MEMEPIEAHLVPRPEQALEAELMENLPAFPDDHPDEFPEISADATLTLPSELYAPWFRSIQVWLDKAGAKNGEDYRASVCTAGMDDKRRQLFRVKWRTLSEKGVLYLNIMARTLQHLQLQSQEQLSDQSTPKIEGPK